MRYETYSLNSAEPPVLRSWLLIAFLLSLALHGALFAYFHMARVDGFVFAEENLTRTKPFNMKRVSLPPMPEEKQAVPPPVVPPKAALTLPSEKPQVEEVHLAPQLAELSKQVFAEKPRADNSLLDRLAKADETSRQTLDKEISRNLGDLLLKDAPRMPRQPRVSVGGRGAAGEGDAVGIPGLNSLDDLLTQTGSLQAGDKAAMSGGALFAYDQAMLVPEAVESLKKLGILIKQNPNVTFSIEGHSDSFGSPEYNMKLSVRRAEAVKAWLVENMAIAPERIQTRGLGSTKLLVTADKSLDEQAPNRRVEIVLKTNRRPK